MIEVHIERTPRGEVKPLATFVLEFDVSRPILDLLCEIEANHDPTLVFRHSCHHGSCGTCAIRANGCDVLACATSIVSVLSSQKPALRLAPIIGHEVIADLAVDPSTRFSEMPSGISTKRPVVGDASETSTRNVSLVRFENCIECGLCVSACPESGSFVGPLVLSAIRAELEKNPDFADRYFELAHSPRGVAGCQQAFECSRVCPTNVYPSRKINDLRRMFAERNV